MEAIAQGLRVHGHGRRLRAELRRPAGHAVREPGGDAGLREDVMASVQPAMPRLFSTLPRMRVGVRPIPPDREASAASNYTAGTADGARPGWFNLNTYRPARAGEVHGRSAGPARDRAGPSPAVGAGARAEGVPAFQRAFNAAAFCEGWALYAEGLGADARRRLSRPADPFRPAGQRVVPRGAPGGRYRPACHGVVAGPGARVLFVAHVPSQSLAEVDRYIARPGQALGLQDGPAEDSRAARAGARRRSAPASNPGVPRRRAAERAGIPLDLLEEQVDTYISEAARR